MTFMYRLHKHTLVPPGEYVIRVVVRDQVVTPTYSPCGGQAGCYQFGPSPLMSQVAKEYIAFLRGNGLPGFDYGQVVALIDSYTCTRLGNARQWCYDSDKLVSETSPTVLAAKGKCAGCGAKV